MRSRTARRLVIDASVAGAAGGAEAVHPTSKNCTEFLETVRDRCDHRVVMTPELSIEWNKHRSQFAMGWRKSMIARKRVYRVNPTIDEGLRNKIEKTATRERDREAMQKDFLLIEAAMATDNTVSSLDEVVRGLFTAAAVSVGEIRSVVWVNPDQTEEHPILWLENGAKPETARMLGAKAG